jgi:hypothetical protein
MRRSSARPMAGWPRVAAAEALLEQIARAQARWHRVVAVKGQIHVDFAKLPEGLAIDGDDLDAGLWRGGNHESGKRRQDNRRAVVGCGDAKDALCTGGIEWRPAPGISAFGLSGCGAPLAATPAANARNAGYYRFGVSVGDCVRVVSPRTARSQVQGGAVRGIGAALREGSEVDPRFGGFLNADIAEYVVPVNADIGSIEVDFIDTPDPRLNDVGV